jgi:hypothetical protein
VVAATHIALVFEALHHNRSDSHWEARKLLFALHCKPRESTIFEMFNWSCFCWVASEFVATHIGSSHITSHHSFTPESSSAQLSIESAKSIHDLLLAVDLLARCALAMRNCVAVETILYQSFLHRVSELLYIIYECKVLQFLHHIRVQSATIFN